MTPGYIIGNPENRRVQLFLEACSAKGIPPPVLISWLDLIRGQIVPPKGECWVRIESPGENPEVELSLLKLGAQAAEEEGACDWLSLKELAQLSYERGRIYPLRQWYLGWCRILRDIAATFPTAARYKNQPSEIARMFDKLACHERLGPALTPQLLGVPIHFEQMISLMELHRTNRVFLKPRHSSSASGVVALERSRHGIRARTSVDAVGDPGPARLYNVLRVRSYDSLEEIRRLVDAVCRHGCVLEAWVPKAGFHGQTFDLRILVINQRACHMVMRQSRTPMTNLHLGNQRGDLHALRLSVGEENWQRWLALAETAAVRFPGALYCGVDLLVAPGFARAVVCEVNAFGDLLPRVLYEGKTTYEAELMFV